jgi:hypothetical protein
MVVLSLSRGKSHNLFSDAGAAQMVRWVFSGVAFVALVACSSPEDMGERPGLPEEDQAGQSATETPQSALDRRLARGAEPMAMEQHDERGNASREFKYAWPAQISAIPSLVEMLGHNRDAMQHAQITEWEQSIAEFGVIDCITCVSRSYSKEWKVLADTPRFLVIAGKSYSYTGGAHGSPGFQALVWDRDANGGAGRALNPVDLFAGEAAIKNAAFGEYCAALLAERGRRLGMNINGMDPSEDCPGVSDLVLHLGSSDGQSLDRLGLYAASYVAGSYAEGPYDITIAITPALLGSVKPAYRAAFAVGPRAGGRAGE